MASSVITIALAFCLFAPSTSKVFEPCELARELLEVHEIPSSQIATWVCLARHESEYNTAAVNHGSGDHGLFQISQLFWCSPPGYACGVSCNDLHDDDIEDDVICARRIYREHQRLSGDGFNAWVVYHQHCKNKNYAEGLIKGCDLKANEVRNFTDLPIPDYFPQFKSRTKPTESSIFGPGVKIGLNKEGGKTIYPPQKTTQGIQASKYSDFKTKTTNAKFTTHPGSNKFSTGIKSSITTTPLDYTKINTGIKSSFTTAPLDSTKFGTGDKSTSTGNTKYSTGYSSSSTYLTSTNQATNQYFNQPKSTFVQTSKKTTNYYQYSTQKPTSQYFTKKTNVKSSLPSPTKGYTFTTSGFNSAKTTTPTEKDAKSGSASKPFSYSINKTGFRFERTSF